MKRRSKAGEFAVWESTAAAARVGSAGSEAARGLGGGEPDHEGADQALQPGHFGLRNSGFDEGGVDDVHRAHGVRCDSRPREEQVYGPGVTLGHLAASVREVAQPFVPGLLVDLDATLALARAGHVIARGTQEELTRHLPGELRVTFADPTEPELRLPTTDPGADLAALLAAGRTPVSVDIRRPSLDDLYHSLEAAAVEKKTESRDVAA